MKISLNVVLAHCASCYFQYFLQLTLQVVLYRLETVYYKYMNCNKETGAEESFNYQTAFSS